MPSPKTAFDGTKFKAGTKAYTTKEGQEFAIAYKGSTNLPAFPFTASITGPDGGEDFTLVSNSGKLNSGEELYMKAAPSVTGHYTGTGTVKGYVNIYVGDNGKPKVGTRIHPTAAKAAEKAKNADSEIIKAGVPISW